MYVLESGLIKDCSCLLAPQNSEHRWLVWVLTRVAAHFTKKPSVFYKINPPSSSSVQTDLPTPLSFLSSLPPTLGAAAATIHLRPSLSSPPYAASTRPSLEQGSGVASLRRGAR